MIIITVTDCPRSLRGDLTNWLFEIDTGVYVGKVSARVRDKLWERVCEFIKTGRATMVFKTSNEQGFDFRVHNTRLYPIDFDGLKLMLRPSDRFLANTEQQPLKLGFSNASKHKIIQKTRCKQKRELDTYVVIDIETTGLVVAEDKIIEIAAIKIEKGEIVRSFQELIKVDGPIPVDITKLTGITEQTLSSQGKMQKTVLLSFLSFVDGLPVIAHNMHFDYEFLYKACKDEGLTISIIKGADTVELARKKVLNIRDYSLDTLANYFGIKMDNRHRALSDCITAKLLYEKLINL